MGCLWITLIRKGSALYRIEYNIAKYSISKIESELDIKIGSSETGLIALHINAAKMKHNVSLSINELRIYKEVLKLINESLDEYYNDDISNLFLLTINRYITTVEDKIKINMPIKAEVFKSMSNSYRIALELKKS